MKKLLITALVAMFMFAFTGSAMAVVLAPGAGDTSVSGIGSYTLGSLVDSIVAPFSFGSDTLHPMTGTVTQEVRTGDGSGLLFTYLIARTDVDGTEVISRLTATNFTSFTTDVDYDGNFSGIPVNTVDRNSAAVVGFDFATGITKYDGDTSHLGKLLWIQTDALYYDIGTVSLINGRTQDLDVFGPIVPEPMTVSLLGMGILGLFGIRKRKS